MKKDNRGVSLIELVVVLAIMAVMMASVGISVSVLSRKSVDKCAERLKQVMQSNRSATMGRYDSKLEIYIEDGMLYAREYTKRDASSAYVGQNPVELGVDDIRLEIEAAAGDGSSSVSCVLGDVGGVSRLILQFDRSSGGLKKMPAEMGSTLAGKYCTKITLTRGTKIREIEIFYLTGKLELK